jgi:UDP-N-acetylmuramoylalanine--D-glutamate ligase
VTLDVAGRRVAVVGLAASGLAAVRALAARGASVRVTEARRREDVAEAAAAAEAAGAEVATGGHRPEDLDGVDLVVTSPGVPEHADVLRWAIDRGLPVWSELELGARLATVRYVGITGTNGKTTTTEMVAAALRRAGYDAVACGNVGHPFSAAAMEGHDALAVEASSFQLRFQESFHPTVSVLLNLAADHLDWHRSEEAYRDAKARIYDRQGPGDVHVGNRDDRASAEVSSSAPCDVVWFTLHSPAQGEVGFQGDELVSRLDGDDQPLARLAEATPAHRANAAAAAAAGLVFGVDGDAVGRSLAEFEPLPHRGRVVAEVDGIRFVDDSKATNPHAALASIRGFDHAVLICGGRSKGVDLTPMAAAVPHVDGVVVLGEAADELEAIFAGRVEVRRATSIEDAVRLARAMAAPGRAVVLAPACSSWDMFRDYGERGDRFAAAARSLASGGREAV